jgi:hypothetical protein
MAIPILAAHSRKVVPVVAAAFAVGATSVDDYDTLRIRSYRHSSNNGASCEAAPTNFNSERYDNPFLKPKQQSDVILRRRMTPVGRFSLKSETETNLSIPVFFLALSGTKTKKEFEGDNVLTQMTICSPRRTDAIFAPSDLEDAWTKQNMAGRHPRFHSVVDANRSHFEEKYPNLNNHVSETVHSSGPYREDLRRRIEHLLTSPIDVSDKLWEVKVSNGPLGSSGAIGKAKTNMLLGRNKTTDDEPPMTKSGKGGLWSDAALKGKNPTESILLFRSHHALADGASIMAALCDLCDEGEEIRNKIRVDLEQWKRGKGGKHRMGFLRRIFMRLARLLKLCAWLTIGTARVMLYQSYLQITTKSNPFDAVRDDMIHRSGDAGLPLGRSISWCDVASLDEVKLIARTIGKSITINDIFVSCVTSAVARQLKEHEEYSNAIGNGARCNYTVPNINVVVPVHLRGGVILPGESVGNNIGAFVAKCPGEMKDNNKSLSSTVDRLICVHESMSRSKYGPTPLISHYIARFCSTYLPDSMTTKLFSRANANAAVVVSNTRGYEKKLHIHGMTVESAAGFLPLPPGIPIGVVVQSYAGVISLTVTAEKYAVPDADKFLGWVIDDYKRLCEEARKLA